MTRPKDIIKLYAALFVMGAVFYTTLYRLKQDGNLRTNREINKRPNSNKSVKLED